MYPAVRSLPLIVMYACAQVAGFVALLVIAEPGTLQPVVLIALLVLCLSSEFIDIEFRRVTFSGTLIGVVIAMALLGPFQAALLSVLSYGVWALRKRPRVPFAVLGVLDSMITPIAGALVITVVARYVGASPVDLEFAAAVAAGFLTTQVLSIVTVVVSYRLVDGRSISEQLREVFLPLLPSDAAMIILTALIVFAEGQLGATALVLLVAVVLLYLYLLRELSLSQERGEELQRRSGQLAALQVGVLTAMLRTLSMRDRMTARHSAAVARYAREIARAAGCTEEEQDFVHTAGLLHDIGKFILPDHILCANSKLTEDDWELVKRHPFQGARVVREVDGYGPVADVIWAHHERIDGGGYPRGLTGEEIPLFSRMISIADTYDVMTSRDSYRDPVSSAEAIAELRRVSDKQLDGRLVELFVEVLDSKGVAFRHGDDADFEAELAFERRVRDYAAPRAVAEPRGASAPSRSGEPIPA